MSEKNNLFEGNSNWQIFFNKNQNIIIGVLSGILILVIAYVGVKNFYLPEQNTKAEDDVYMAQIYFQKDSFQVALDGTAEWKGFLDIIDDYGWTATGNTANYYAGVCYFKLGDYDKALKYLGKFKGDDMVVGAMALGLSGDIYGEKGDFKKSLSYYQDAADYSDNDFTAPMYMFKAALTQEKLGDISGALKTLNAIADKYPNFQKDEQTVQANIARLEQK